jgi:hypothetical protein
MRLLRRQTITFLRVMVPHFFSYQYEYVDYVVIYEFVGSDLAAVLGCMTLNDMCKLETSITFWVSNVSSPNG